MLNISDSLQSMLRGHKQNHPEKRLNLVDFNFKKLKKEDNDLSKSDFSYTILNHTNLDGFNLIDTDFSYAILHEVYFSSSLLNNANFTRSSLSGNFTYADLSDVIFEQLHIIGLLDLKGTYFSTDSFYQLCNQLKENSINNGKTFFRGSILRDVDFSSGYKKFCLNLNHFDFSDCDLQGTNFSNMDLTKISFHRVKSKFIQFIETILTPRQLVEFYQGGARDFSQVILRGDVSDKVRKFSFFAAQLSTQAIAYLSEQGWQASLSTRISVYSASDRVIGNLETESVEKLIPVQVIKSIEKQFSEVKKRQNEFFYFNKNYIS